MDPWRAMGSFTVRAVPDPLTVVLDNGKVVRLAGIDLPVFPGEKESPFAALALQRMQSLYLGQKITLYQTRDVKKGRTDSMGRQMGQIVRMQGERQIWAQKILVEEGLARVLPTLSNSEGAEELYEAESKPRDGRKGIWSTSPWSVKDPDSVAAYAGTVQVVRGKVHGIATRNNLTYLNFDRDWKTDFTIEIDAATRRALLRRNTNLMNLANKTVEVRGYVENKNGPNIKLDSPLLLRVLNAPPKAEETKEEEPQYEQGSEVIKVEALPDLPEQDTEEEGQK